MEQILKEMRKTMLRVSAAGKDGNLQSCFSSLEILWALYNGFLPLSKADISNKNRNRFVLSKGQSNLALMVVLAEKGLIEESELYTFCQFGSRISMQADRTKFGSLIEASAGSLGHGFPISVGMAWANRIKGSRGRVFCLAGDGEMNEGTMWEAALFSSSEKLNNLTLIVDYNHSLEKMIHVGDMGEKLNAFGFDVIRVDGHDLNQLTDAYHARTQKPVAVLAETIRGWGSKTLMEDRSWFHRYPGNDELEILFKEVDEF